MAVSASADFDQRTHVSLDRGEARLDLALALDQHADLPPQELQIDLGQPHLRPADVTWAG